MVTDAELGWVVAVIGVVAWSIAALLEGLDSPVRGVVLLFVALGMLAVSTLVIQGPLRLAGDITVSATLVATVNRAVVAAVGTVYAVRAGVRVWESRRGPGSRET